MAPKRPAGPVHGCSTWHDDVREAQLPGDGDAAGEEDHVLAPQLLDVAVQQLQSHRQTCKQKQIPVRFWSRRWTQAELLQSLVAMAAKANNNSVDLLLPTCLFLLMNFTNTGGI